MQSGALKEPGWRIRSQIDLCRIAFVTLTAKESTGQSFAERVIARGRSQHADFSMEPANHTFLELRSEQRPRLLAHILGDRHGRQFGLCRQFVTDFALAAVLKPRFARGRTEPDRVRKECVSTCSSWWSPDH